LLIHTPGTLEGQRSSVKTRLAFTGAALVAAALAACGGGGGGGGSSPIPPPTSSPTTAPPTVTATLGASPTSAPLPSLASGSVLLPSGSGTITMTGLTTAPSPVPTIFTVQRSASTLRPFASGGNTAVIYVKLTATGGAVTMNGFPGVTVTLPAGSTPGTYYVAYWANGQQPAWESTSSPGAALSANGGTITIAAAATTTPVSLSSGQSIYLALYVGSYIPPINILGCVGTPSPAPPVTADRLRPALVGVHPITGGDSYTYVGTLAQTIYRSQPCPQPTASASAQVTVTVSMSPDPSIAGASDENSIEQDAYPLGTQTFTTTAVVSTPLPASPQRYYESTETMTDGVGDTVVTTYASPGLQFAQTPERASNTWSNNEPQTYDQTLADGSTFNRTYPGAGIYTETDTIQGNGTNVITANTDGSGTYEIGKGSTAGDVLFTIGAPSGGYISFAVSVNGTPAGTTLQVPLWYTLPLTFYSDTTLDDGSPTTSLPSACASAGWVSPTYAFESLVRTIDVTDPILGYTEKETIDTYDVPSYNNGTTTVTLGPVCAVISDTVDTYYDYSFTTPFAAYVSGNAQPIMTNTIDETLALQQGSSLKALSASRAASVAAHFSSEIAARAAGIRFTRALERARTAESLAHAVRTRAILGGAL
jgi:hypothetical protein